MKRFFFAWCIIAAASSVLFGAVSGSRFLLLGAGARPTGMGGAFAGLADDVSAGYWNPAGLVSLKGMEVLTMYNSWIEGTGHAYAAFGKPLASDAAFAAQVNYFTAGDIPRISETGIAQGSFKAYDAAAVFSYARRAGKKLSLGGSLKVIEERIEEAGDRGFALDLGLLYRPAERLGIGVTVQNFGQGIRLISETAPLPLMLKAGASWRAYTGRDAAVTLLSDMTMLPFDRTQSAALGGEAFLYRMIALRAGIRIGNSVVPSLGLGFVFRNICVDWATELYGDLGNPSRVSLTLKY